MIEISWMKVVQIPVFAFFAKRVHDCGAAGWGGALAQVFGWTLLSGFLAMLLTMLLALVAGLVVAVVAGRLMRSATKKKTPATAATRPSLGVTRPSLGVTRKIKKSPIILFNAGSLELAEPYAFASQAVILVVQVLLLLRFTRCA
jgi:hypothetical protein